MTDLGQYQNLTFATAPKTRRHLTRGAFISAQRAAEFMQHLWEVGLKKSCRSEVLEYEFIKFFGTNDKRTVERYIGRPKQVIRSAGSTNIVRQNLQSGKIAQFNYFNVRNVPAKKGLLEDLEYIKRIEENGQTRYLLNHERMSYFTQQATLETGNDLPEMKEESVPSNDDLCVRSLLVKESDIPFITKGKECEKTDFGGCLTTSIEVEKKEEEEVIDGTHTNQSSESATQNAQNTHRELTPEALLLLKASQEASR